MITLTTTSSDVVTGLTATDSVPYFVVAKTLYIIDISASIANDIVALFKAGKFDTGVNHCTIQQYDIYRDTDEFKAGLAILFDYFIFYNQMFVDNEFNIIAPNATFLAAAKEQVLASQKTITSTGNLFPSAEISYLDSLDWAVQLKGALLLDNNPPLPSVRFTIGLSKSYEEIKYIRDASKDVADTSGSSSSSGGGTTMKKYYTEQHIQHDIVGWAIIDQKTNFYGKLSLNTQTPNGNISIDVWKMVKEVGVYDPPGATTES